MKVGDKVQEEIAFQIVEEIGQGNYGVVYKAVQEGVERTVALKELRNPTSSVSTLSKEAWINGSLIHPNIVSVLLFDEKKGLIVMEYVPNSLKQRVTTYFDRKEKFDEGDVTEMLRQCLGALSYAHEHGCRFHGDIKPANILITEDGTYKIGDFGVSLSYMTGPSDLSGSETWAAPEVMKAWKDKRKWTGDHRSDLFSLGVVAYILLMGRNPFVDPTGIRKPIEYLLDSNYSPPAVTTKDPNVGFVVMKLLAREPSKRFQSAREALDRLLGLAQQPSMEIDLTKERTLQPLTPETKAEEYTSEELQRLAYDSNQNGNYESGEKYATESIRKNPSNVYAHQTRGFARSNLGKFEDAISDFTTAIQMCPSSWNTKLGQLYYQRAFAEGMKGDLAKACEDIRQALSYDPTNSKYQYFRLRYCKDYLGTLTR